MSPNCEKVSERSKIAKSTEANSAFHRIFSVLASLSTETVKDCTFYILSRNNPEINYMQELHDGIECLKRDLAKTCDSSLRLSKLHAQFFFSWPMVASTLS